MDPTGVNWKKVAQGALAAGGAAAVWLPVTATAAV